MASNIGSNVSHLIVGIIGAVVILIVGIELGPTVTTYLGYINSTSMANVTMGGVLVLLAGYGSFFYYFGLVMGAVLTFWGVTRVLKK